MPCHLSLIGDLTCKTQEQIAAERGISIKSVNVILNKIDRHLVASGQNVIAFRHARRNKQTTQRLFSKLKYDEIKEVASQIGDGCGLGRDEWSR